MNNKFGPRTQYFIRATSSKKKTRVLALLMFYEKIKNPKKAFKVLSWVIYTIFSNNVCIDYLACESEKLSEIPVGSGGVLKHGKQKLWQILGIRIPDLLMNLMSCHGFLKNKKSVVILKCPKIMLEYYFSKGFTFLNAILLIWKNFQMR